MWPCDQIRPRPSETLIFRGLYNAVASKGWPQHKKICGIGRLVFGFTVWYAVNHKAGPKKVLVPVS